MTTEPKLENRNEQPYVAIRVQVPIPFGNVLGQLWGEGFAWMASKGIAPSGPPFIRYLTTDMATKLDLEVGWPVATIVPGNGRISTGLLPAGRYSVLLYTGHFDNLAAVTASFCDWAKENHIVWQSSTIDGVEWWANRLEFYPVDPGDEPDPNKWQTKLVFLTAE